MKKLAIILPVLAACSGCKDPLAPANVENAAAVAQYEALLQVCRDHGKEAKSYEVYEACAQDVDHTLCVQTGARCVDGGAK